MKQPSKLSPAEHCLLKQQEPLFCQTKVLSKTEGLGHWVILEAIYTFKELRTVKEDRGVMLDNS